MRVRHWLLGVSASFVASAIVTVGCSSSTVTPAKTATDAGHDANNAPVDAGTSDDATAACAVDASLTGFTVPDAALGDGSATASECLTCTQSMCPDSVNACLADCDCRGALAQFGACVQTGMNFESCGETAFAASASALPLGLAIADCVQMGPCAAMCGLSAKDAGSPVDSGAHDSAVADSAAADSAATDAANAVDSAGTDAAH